uniref:putative phosphatase phospho1 n=1 Tax=Monopterus albus TaxID=43700 RepID=UPI0009B2FC7B|nr:probable phosphatase phospho1 [Monopterus albus]XP_020446099.1 probable phosphatase phospho1 [Monopterus albus]XP_020446100.1 probable phosphatase phospho1 [Monopterus albus]
MGDSVFNCCYVPPPGKEEIVVSRRPETMAPNSAHISSDKRFLIFFDFDETIVDETSDDMVVQAAPGQHLPDWLKDTYQPGRYNEYMQRVLAYLAEQGVTESDIRSIMEKLPATPGMLTLFQFLRTRPPQDFEVVLVSDANAFFIESWLRRVGARPLFHHIFSNPATFNKNGRLVLKPFHSSDCPRCPINMCKQVIVRDYIARRTQERRRPYQRVFYVGDGANDFCPALSLGPRDVAFPRRDFPMHRLITEIHESMPGEFKAVTVPWVSGEDVVQRLKTFVTEDPTRRQRGDKGDD